MMYPFLFLIFIKGVHNLNKIIIIGAVAGGATCASQIRRLDKSEIIVFEKDRDMSFANCALPYILVSLLLKGKKY